MEYSAGAEKIKGIKDRADEAPHTGFVQLLADKNQSALKK
jgi:hypothetical protein